MICPHCGSDSPHRSRRRSVRDHLLGWSGLRPWRCGACTKRFYAWKVAARYVASAHCRRCGNLNLQRIGREHVTEGPLRWLWRPLRVPAYRCDPCRNRFFSFRRSRSLSAEVEKLPPAGDALPDGN